MDQQAYMLVGDQVEGFLRGRVRGHYYRWYVGVGRARKIRVVHEGDVGKEVRACREVELEDERLAEDSKS